MHSVTSGSQKDLCKPSARLQSQIDCSGVQLPATATRDHCTKASLAPPLSSPVNTTKPGGWLTVPIGESISDTNKQLASGNREDESTGLVKFLAMHNVDLQGAREVALQIKVSYDERNPHLPMFTQQIFDDRPHLQVWSKALSL